MSKKAAATNSTISSHEESLLVERAKAAVLEITEAHTFRLAPTITRGDGVATVAFASAQPGYPGWSWTVSLSDVPDMTPTVLELELLPGEGSLVAPDWVPWSDRMEEYLLHEKELSEAGADEASDEDDDDDDVDFDDDVDGVDIDQLDLELDPAPLEIPDEPTDLFDHVEFDEADPLDP
jgi:hypothetical protein